MSKHIHFTEHQNELYYAILKSIYARISNEEFNIACNFDANGNTKLADVHYRLARKFSYYAKGVWPK